MIQVINNMETFTGKERKMGLGEKKKLRAYGKKREKLIKKLGLA